MSGVIVKSCVKVFKHNSGKCGKHCAVRLESDKLKKYFGKKVILTVKELV